MAVPHGFLEVIDSLLLFCNSHKNESNDICLWISLTLNDAETRIATNRFLSLDFKVRVGGLGAYYTNGTSFLQNLLECFTNVHKLLSSLEDSLIRVLCRRIGDYNNVSVFERKLGDTPTPPVTESVLPRPFDFTSLTLEIKQIHFDSELITSTFSFLNKHIVMSQLINPQMTIYLNTNLSVLGNTSIALTPLSWIRIVSTNFKLASTLDAHIGKNSLSKWKKIRLLRSCPVTLSKVELSERYAVPIRLLSYVGVLPYFRLTKGKKIPADRICTRIQVSFYGPGNIVLFPIGTESSFDVRDIVNWSDYRIVIGEKIEPLGSQDLSSSCTSSFEYKLSSLRAEEDKLKKRILKIFIFIEEEITEEQRLRYKRSPHQRWSRYTELTMVLRNNFNRFLITERKKFRKVLHSALNKMICNYGSFEKVNSTVTSAIPVLSDAVSNIIRNSSNKHFQQTCLNTLNTCSIGEIDAFIDSRLRCLANTKLSVGAGSNHKCPQEPSTPELEEAIINNRSDNIHRVIEVPHCNTVNPYIDEQLVPTVTRNIPTTTVHTVQQNSSNELVNNNVNVAADSTLTIDHFDNLLGCEEILLEIDHSSNNNNTGDNNTQSNESWNNFEDFEIFDPVQETSPFESLYNESANHNGGPHQKKVDGSMSPRLDPLNDITSCAFDELGNLEMIEDDDQFILEQLLSNCCGEYDYKAEDFTWD